MRWGRKKSISKEGNAIGDRSKRERIKGENELNESPPQENGKTYFNGN